MSQLCKKYQEFLTDVSWQTDPPPIGGIMTRTTEHCLMGIRGTVRRSSDGWFVHCNIDTDVIIWEGDPTGKEFPVI